MVWFVLGHSGQGTSVKCAEAAWNYKSGGVVHLKSPVGFFPSFFFFWSCDCPLTLTHPYSTKSSRLYALSQHISRTFVKTIRSRCSLSLVLKSTLQRFQNPNSNHLLPLMFVCLSFSHFPHPGIGFYEGKCVFWQTVKKILLTFYVIKN